MDLDKQHLIHLRRLDEQSDFRQQCREFLNTFPRFDKVLIAVRRDLQDFAHLEPNPYQGYYWKETAQTADTPSFAICYTLDDSTVYIYSIELTAVS